jgi:DNA-binding NarL/FixJ family response regulator
MYAQLWLSFLCGGSFIFLVTHIILYLYRREKEILQLLAEGNSYKQIAAACHISFDTVRTHIRNVYEKLHVATNTEAVAKTIKEHLVQ